MNFKKFTAASLALLCMCGSMVGCGDNAVNSSLSESTLETAAGKLEGTWKGSGLYCTSNTKMIIDVESDGEVPVNMKNVWVGGGGKVSDSNAYISSFNRNGNETGDFYYKGNLNYHSSYDLEYYVYVYTNKNMNKIWVSSKIAGTFKKS